VVTPDTVLAPRILTLVGFVLAAAAEVITWAYGAWTHLYSTTVTVYDVGLVLGPLLMGAGGWLLLPVLASTSSAAPVRLALRLFGAGAAAWAAARIVAFHDVYGADQRWSLVAYAVGMGLVGLGLLLASGRIRHTTAPAGTGPAA
jgi:hypothetical protein